ncbi:MAG: hypothetical protein FWG10_01075 [Eubacteriaceae bacterium]|nr:hypothetical protein [Eubacteriaceae bacterium]
MLKTRLQSIIDFINGSLEMLIYMLVYRYDPAKADMAKQAICKAKLSRGFNGIMQSRVKNLEALYG